MTDAVTVLGLGPMGQAIAGAFHAAGHPTTAWTRTATRPAPDGVARAATATEAVTASKVVVVCLLDYDAARAVLEPVAAELRGRPLVHLTSGSPDAARAMAAWAAAHGIPYIDGAIMTPTDTIGTPAAVILHSGPSRRPYWRRSAARRPTSARTRAGPRRYDVALLDLFWTSVSGLVHAFAVAGTENITPSELAPLAKGIADLMPIVIDEHSTRLEEDRHDGDYANLNSAAAGMAHVIHTAEARGIDASIMRAAHALTRRAIADGHGKDGISRLTVQLRCTASPP